MQESKEEEEGAPPRVVRIGKRTDRVATDEELTKFQLRERLAKSAGEEEERAGKGRKGGKAKRPQFSPASLKSTCVDHIAANFEELPHVDRIPADHLVQFYSGISASVDIFQAAKSIADENYWKRRAEREGVVDALHVDLAQHGQLWKRLYFERAVKRALEDPSVVESREQRQASFQHLLKAARDFVWVLELEQACADIDARLLLKRLSNLSVLKLTYGVKKIGMDFAKEMFGMKVADATVLADGLKSTTTLTTLKLPCNLVDDDTARLLLTGLLGHATITALDLSHNRITNDGARQIAKLLGPKNVLVDLDLADNQIHVEGSRFLGRALMHNRSLLKLKMRLNRMTDEGGRAFLEALSSNSVLEELDIGSNSIGSESCLNLAKLLAKQTSALQVCDLSGNELSEPDLANIKKALEVNTRMVSLDLRGNPDIASESPLVDDIGRILKRNEQDSVQETTPQSASE